MPHLYIYEEFFEQMALAKLSIWNNKYTEVFDFTPSKSGTSNFEVKISEIEEE
jgi:hypothetical protein